MRTSDIELANIAVLPRDPRTYRLNISRNETYTSGPAQANGGSWMGPERFSSSEMQDKGYADLRKLKSTVQKLLPLKSMLQNLILCEPDFIPRSEALVKIPMFAMLDEELRSDR